MRVVSLITARGGSKGIPKKNLIDINGRPLIWYSIRASLDSKVDETWVSTDSEEIQNASVKAGARVIIRPDDLADDYIMPDEVLLHFAQHVEFDILAFIQPTSPLIKAEYINKSWHKEHNDWPI